MSAANIAAYAKNAATPGSSAATLVAACQDTIDNPSNYSTRGGSDGDNWPSSAMSCAFAYRVTQKASYLTQAIKYLQASLDDDQTLGDKAGCVAGVNTNWQSWDGNPPAPPIILTITHDTGYPMRWYGPDVALAYDWLSGVTGVSAALLTQTRTCLTAWLDYYSQNGYHAAEAGANYNAGFVVGKALGAVAIGNDGGADGHLWNETVDSIFAKLLVGQGLAGATSTLGMPVGPMVGGDWLEGWQYGPLSVLEYAVATRALEENGSPQPEMEEWTNSLALRYIHGTVPTMDGQWVGGDFDDTDVYESPTVNTLDAVLAGPSNAETAAWAAFHKKAQSLSSGPYFYNALAEINTVAPADYRAQTPAPSLYYVARGSRAMYARTAWDASAFWSVFSSAPAAVDDHEHFAAGNFVFTRGADHLIVDPSNYGEPATFETNAIAADADLDADYTPSQTPWSTAELVWARGTSDAVYAARSDFAGAFAFDSSPSTIPYAQREWVFLPEGEVVTIDRLELKDASHHAYLGFHANTGGTLALTGNSAKGKVGGSDLVIHGVVLSGGTPTVTQPMVGSCSLSCNYPCGACAAARFAVDDYTVKVPGPWAVAVHVIDGLAAGEQEAVVDSLNDDTIDPPPKQNTGVLGAAVNRGSKQTYVVASSAMLGAAGPTMTYGVPGGSAQRHVVFDAPEDANAESVVTASAAGGRCVITIAAGAGFAGHPLMFSVSSAADGCKATASTEVSPGSPPDGGAGTGGSSSSGSESGSSTGSGGSTGAGGSTGSGGSGVSGSSSGCKCGIAGDARGGNAALILVVGAAVSAGVGRRIGRRARRRAARAR